MSPLALVQEKILSDVLPTQEKQICQLARQMRTSVARTLRWQEAFRTGAGFSCGICLRGNAESDEDSADRVPLEERMIQLAECECIVWICAPCLAESMDDCSKGCLVCGKRVWDRQAVSVALLRELEEEVGAFCGKKLNDPFLDEGNSPVVGYEVR